MKLSFFNLLVECFKFKLVVGYMNNLLKLLKYQISHLKKTRVKLSLKFGDYDLAICAYLYL